MSEKTSAWTEEEREAIPPKSPQLPPWFGAFAPDTIIGHNGWEAIIRHVGCEDGRWMILIEPELTGFLGQKARDRRRFKQLKRTIGKKKAWAKIKEGRPNVNSPTD